EPTFRSLIARRVSLGPANGSHFPATSSAAEKLIAAVGFKPRHADAGRHIEFLQNFSGLRIDAAHIALLAFPGAVPKLALDPGDAGDEAVGLDGAKDRSCFGIDLMDFAGAMLA